MADPPKKEMKYNLRSKKKQNYKCNDDSDDSDSDYLPIEESSGDESVDEAQWDREGYKDFLCKMFPSKYMKERCKRITPKRKGKKSAKKNVKKSMKKSMKKSIEKNVGKK